MSLDASDLKRKGISAVEARLKVDEEVVISVCGQDRYVIMDLEKYKKLREYELAIAVQEAKGGDIFLGLKEKSNHSFEFHGIAPDAANPARKSYLEVALVGQLEAAL